jgi:hypothetical protein
MQQLIDLYTPHTASLYCAVALQLQLYCNSSSLAMPLSELFSLHHCGVLYPTVSTCLSTLHPLHLLTQLPLSIIAAQSDVLPYNACNNKLYN